MIAKDPFIQEIDRELAKISKRRRRQEKRRLAKMTPSEREKYERDFKNWMRNQSYSE